MQDHIRDSFAGTFYRGLGGTFLAVAFFASCRTAQPAPFRFSLGGPADRSIAFQWVAIPADDTIRPPMPLGRTEISQRSTEYAGEPALLQVLSVPGRDWHDTLLIRRRDLLPIWEHARSRDVAIHVDYDGRRVRWSRRRGDSTVSQGDSIYATPVYAFNQLELIIRSIPLEVGRTMVVPFYSEGSPEVEGDTITVLSAPGTRDPTWTIRFADAAIYTVYHLDPDSRDVLAAEVTYRPRGTRYQRLQAP